MSHVNASHHGHLGNDAAVVVLGRALGKGHRYNMTPPPARGEIEGG